MHPDIETFILEAEALRVRPRDERPTRPDPRHDPAIAELVDAIPIDRAKADLVVSQHARELRAHLEAQAEEAADATDADARRLDALSFGPVIDGLVAGDPTGATVTVIDTMNHIRAWPDTGAVESWNVGPGDNWAKYEFKAASEDLGRTRETARLSFYALWQNPRNSIVSVGVTSQLKVNGVAQAFADSLSVAAWVLPEPFARAEVRARLTVWSLSSAGASAVVADELMGVATATGGFFGDAQSARLAETRVLSGAGFAVAPGGWLMVETALVAEYEVFLGSVTVSASGSPRLSRVDCPAVTVTID